MKKYLLLFLIVAATPHAFTQQKDLTLEEIWGGAFTARTLESLKSMKDGLHYTILSKDKARNEVRIEKYAYETLELTETILVASPESDVPYFTSYSFSEDERKILLSTEEEKIFRRSKRGIYYIYNVEDKTIIRISDKKIISPSLSPDGSKVAYMFENDLYYLDLTNGSTTRITTDGEKNAIINGITDWVYEEEFGFVRAFEWNADGSVLAFLRFDEREVPEFSMDVYGEGLYPTQNRFKYPKAGEENSQVTLHLYNLQDASTRQIDLSDSYYIPRILWKHNKNELSVRTLNRAQNHLKMYTVKADMGSVSLLMEEKDKAYLDITDDLTFLEDDSFIWTSERDGYNHIYLHNPDGSLKRQLTSGPWEVTRYYGYDPGSRSIFYQSTENGSINRDVYRIGINGKNKKRLTLREGTNSADFSASFTYFINTFSSSDTPNVYTLHKASDGKKVRDILDNSALRERLKGYKTSPKEFSTIEINGYDLNMWMIKPADFDPSKTYPLFLFQYSGPGSQQVANRWWASNDYWHQMLAQQAIVVACVDGRGTGYKGRDFKKMTYLELGKYEVEDQIAVAEKLSEYPWIDADRTGIWGWSYGGFMASNCILQGNETFELAIAVAPVTSWRFYDTIYTERYMSTPQDNPNGYDDNSPLTYPAMLKGDYLLIHGSGDDNVHVQNTMRMIEELVQANKQFDWAIYPDKDHGISGENTRLQLYTKMTNFIKDNL
ncbi:dipeptidyl-peptidase-4 [Muriicola jejuensis]|uniref:Prolyl oligopeptidase family serine peptidase n=1 Tax=Muriicola jejuensis TaxID=504488 RepID=A0A6P0UKR7_9FLAO|nr:S9 family peptidase [Muriicola jejuensis]NER11643.1 prolyl oligopeptidase family serine peptidase [Muriicola jejuensis]SMP25739.1 dipeptidyl-peptidase-4 [Muriicola jejuensis]